MGRGTTRWRVHVDMWLPEQLRPALARAGAQVVRKLIEDAVRQLERVQAGRAYRPDASITAALANIAAARLILDYMLRLHDNGHKVDVEALIEEIRSALDELNSMVEVWRDEA